MDRIRYLAAGLLCLTGIIHVARLGIPPSDAAFDTMAVIFGMVYLATGGWLFRNNRAAYYCGVIVPLIGACGGMAGMLANPAMFSIWMAFLIAVDVVIALSCFYLIKRRRSA